MKPDPEISDAYVKQVRALVDVRDAYLREHPDANIAVQFNYPREVLMVCLVEEALKKNIIGANEAGTELIRKMCAACPDGATVFMVRMAMEFRMPAMPKDTTIVFEHPHNCPNCGKSLDMGTLVGGGAPAQPSPGDLTICIGCGFFMTFQLAGLELLTEEQRNELPPDIKKTLDDMEAALARTKKRF